MARFGHGDSKVVDDAEHDAALSEAKEVEYGCSIDQKEEDRASSTDYGSVGEEFSELMIMHALEAEERLNRAPSPQSSDYFDDEHYSEIIRECMELEEGSGATHRAPSPQSSDYYFGDDNDFSDLIQKSFEGESAPAPPQSLSTNSDASGSSSKRKSDSLDGEVPDSPKRAKLDLFDSDLVADLNDQPCDPTKPFLIAHHPEVYNIIQNATLSRGVLYQLACLLTTGKIKYSDITKKILEQLQGSNEVAAAKVAQMFTALDTPTDLDDPAFAQEIAAHSPWGELDKEEAALAGGPYEGLGNNLRHPGWYGGRIEFRGRLQAVKGKASSFKIVLDPCTLGTSCRFARRFGSWSFIRIKIPQTIFHDKKSNLGLFFQKAFVIWGKVYRACYAKTDNVFLYMTNEKFPFSLDSIPGRLSFEEFVTWHNPLSHNSNQIMAKWSARTVLGFSNSVPGPRLDQNCILAEIDIVSETNSDMTDGCGLTTKNIHRFILDQLSLPILPTAFQFRLCGFKGMLVFRDEEEFKNEDRMMAWFRPSQTKIRYPKDMVLDPAMLTIDLLRTSHLKSSTRISAEIIINLAENGVPHEEFVKLYKKSIREMVVGLTTWDGPDAMFHLWSNVERAGGVLAGRRAREVVGEARLRGYTNKSPEDVELDDDADEDGFSDASATPRSVAWWADQNSGCPSGLEETVMVLLDSGFRPEESPILREKLKQVVVKKIENRLQNLRIDLEQSCTAFAVPDPYGVLGPDEIQIKSSKRNLKMEDGLLTDIIQGDVLVGRNPCKGPCDIRKFKAVEHPMLRNYVDVIVFSVTAHRRLLDWLAGGDYDGDTVVAIWLLAMVAHFTNADENFSKEPQGIDVCFTRDEEKVSAFEERVKDMEPAQRIQEMQVYLLGGLRDTSLVGKYSSMHDNAIYQYGYGNPRTLKLAAKFCRVLDAAKTGYRLKPTVYSKDLETFNHPLGPLWKAGKKDKKAKERMGTSNMTYLKRTQNRFVKGRFIMDVLLSSADEEREVLLKEMNDLFKPLHNAPDPDLLEPWNTAMEWAERGSKEFVKMKQVDLLRIQTHVRKVYRQHKTAHRTVKGKASAHFTDLKIEERQDKLRSVSKAFISGPLLEDLTTIADQATLARYRASYAYKFDAEQTLSSEDGLQGWSRFPWNVAMRELCAIKAASLGLYKVVTNSFYDRFKLERRF